MYRDGGQLFSLVYRFHMWQPFTKAFQRRKENYPWHLHLSANHNLPTMSSIYTFKTSSKAETNKNDQKNKNRNKTLLVTPIAANLAPSCPHHPGASVSLSELVLCWHFSSLRPSSRAFFTIINHFMSFSCSEHLSLK